MLIDKVARINRLAKKYRPMGVIDVYAGRDDGVMLRPDLFLKFFKEYKTEEFDNEYDRLTAEYKGATFFCLKRF